MINKKIEIVESPFGLCNDPGSNKAPAGALEVADNCTIRRDGLIEPRSGARIYALTGLILTTIYRIIPVANDILLIGLVDAVDTMVWKSDPDAALVDEDGDNVVCYPGQARVVQARESYYLNTTKGIRRITPGVAAVENAGVRYEGRPNIQLSNTGIGVRYLATNKNVSYRFTIVKHITNGFFIESLPSMSCILINETGGSTWALIYFYLPNNSYPETYSGDDVYLRIYRTKIFSSSISPGDIHYLVDEVKFAWDPSPGNWKVTYQDHKEDHELGLSLYTNATQQTALKENWIPPVSHDVHAFNGSLFFSDCLTFPKTIFNMENQLDFITGSADRAGVRAATGDFSVGSDTVTNVNSTVGFQCGQLLHGASIDNETYIESFTANTVTMSKVATAAAVGQAFVSQDVIRFKYEGDPVTSYIIAPNDYSLGSHLTSFIMIFLQDTYVSTYISSPIKATDLPTTPWGLISKYNSVYFEPYRQTEPPIKVWATHGESYTPELNGPTLVGGVITYGEADAYAGELTNQRNSLYFSKPDQPEHVTLDFLMIGDNSPITAILGVRDALFVFKPDGLWAVTGYNAYSGWSVTMIDPSLVLLRPDHAVVFDNNVYAITNRGFVKISADGQVSDLSRYLFHSEIQPYLDDLLEYHDTINYLEGWVAIDRVNQFVFFCLGGFDSEHVYVYSPITGAFTRWESWEFVHISRAVVAGADVILVAGDYNEGSKLWRIYDDELGYDRMYINIGTFYLGADPLGLASFTGFSVDADKGYVSFVGSVGDRAITIGDYVDTNSLFFKVITLGYDTWSHLVHANITALDDVGCGCIDTTYMYYAKTEGLIPPYHKIYRSYYSNWTVTPVSTGDAILGNVYGFAFYSSYVYWSTSMGSIYRAAKTGGVPELIADSITSLTGIAISGTNIYYGSGSSIKYRPVSGGGESTLVSGLTSVNGLWVYGTDLYFVQRSATGKISKIPVAGGAVTDIVSDAVWPAAVCVRASDGDVFYDSVYNDNRAIYRYDGTSHLLYDGNALSYVRQLSIRPLDGALYISDSATKRVYIADWDNPYTFLELSPIPNVGPKPSIDIVSPIPVSIRWLPKYGDMRSLRKHFLAGTFSFDSIGDAAPFLDKYNRRLSSGDAFIEADVRDKTCRYIVPHSRAREMSLSPEIKIESPLGAAWKLVGMGLEYSVQAPRGVKE